MNSGKWRKNESRNLNDLFIKYKMPIYDIPAILNRSETDVIYKLVELNLINIEQANLKEIYKNIKPPNKEDLLKLKSIKDNLEKRIKILKSNNG